jgi:hypothetical protein
MYWLASAGQTASPLEDIRGFVKVAGCNYAGNKPQPFDGY